VTLDLVAEVEVLYAFDVLDLLQTSYSELNGCRTVEKGEEVVVLGIYIEKLP
jgi:hypothetical protein